jgi:cell division protein FtsQ
MARRSGTTIQEELYSTADDTAREELDDARLLDLDAEKESPFLRAQKRVSVRRSPLPKKTAARLLWVALAILVAGLGAIAATMLHHYGERSWRFRLDSSDNIELAGLSNVTRPQIMEVMGGDIGRNVFFIPLDQRQKQLEQIPWVATASVMRFAPNRISIQIHERAPVAFARVGSKVALVDAGGVLMELTNKKKFSFPVIVGMSSNEPLSTRSIRMKTFNELVRQLDSSGGHYSQDLSEVDLTDPEDVKVLTNDAEGEVLVHLGSSNYLDRFKIYVAHLREWRQQFAKLESVDLRYDRQIIVNPDLRGTARQPMLTASAAKAAIAAGVKPSALVVRKTVRASAPHTVFVKPVKNARTWTASTSVSSSVSQRARKPGTVAGRIKPASIRRPEKQWPTRKRWVPTKHAASNAAVVPVASQLKPSAGMRKPSPAIAKGQETH